MTDIYLHYREELGRENIPVDVHESKVGLTLKSLFGDQIYVKKHLNKDLSQTRKYINLKRERFSFGVEELVIGSTYYGWTLNKIRDNHVYLFSNISNYYINSNHHAIDLTINIDDQKIIVTGYNGTTLNENDLGLCKEDINYTRITFILYYLSKLTPCLGCPANEHMNKVVKSINDVLCNKIEVKISGDNSREQTMIRSHKCNLFVSTYDTKANNSISCDKCSLVKKRLLHRKAEYKNLKNARNSYLSRDELQQKAEILVTEKRNAIKKAKYWESKFYAESIEVDEEDDADFRQMFDGVSDDQIPEGLKLLFNQQGKAQCAKSACGRRWHPQ